MPNLVTAAHEANNVDISLAHAFAGETHHRLCLCPWHEVLHRMICLMDGLRLETVYAHTGVLQVVEAW